jgi:hypothetical protein
MSNFLKVEGSDSLVRDVSNKAIINTDTTQYNNYIKQKQLMASRKAELLHQAEEINTIKQELNEVKGMLRELIAFVQKKEE